MSINGEWLIIRSIKSLKSNFPCCQQLLNYYVKLIIVYIYLQRNILKGHFQNLI